MRCTTGVSTGLSRVPVDLQQVATSHSLLSHLNADDPNFTAVVDQLPTTGLKFAEDTIFPSRLVRDLGNFVDSDLMMRSQVSRTVSPCFAALRQLRRIRRSVPIDVLSSLVARALGPDQTRLWQRACSAVSQRAAKIV